MEYVILTDKKEIHSFLENNKSIYIYHIGDLDDFYFAKTKWYGLKDGGEIKAVMFTYEDLNMAILLAIAPEESHNHLQELIRLNLDNLPNNFHLHISGECADALTPDFTPAKRLKLYKMLLTQKNLTKDYNTDETVQLKPSDIEEIKELYNGNYPGNWFSPLMLETGMYFGLRESGTLVSIAGVHTYSKKYGAAALGNITTHSNYRGRGYGTKVTARLCKELLKNVDTIGLNVSKDNKTAIHCYEKIGFTPIAEYSEYFVEKKKYYGK